jgi:hypothetical protein
MRGSVSFDVLVAQAAYAARPFAVRWIDSHYSGTFRFETYDEAFEYVQEQWANVQRRVIEERYRASCLWASRLMTPTESVPLAYVLLTDDVSSY